MAGSAAGRIAGVLGDLSRRETATLLVVGLMLAGSHLVAPAVIPEYAVYTQYTAYLALFSVWMAWFVDWLAVQLGKDPHPSERGDVPDPSADSRTGDEDR